MNAVTYLQQQLANINDIFHALADDLTDREWLARPIINQNVIGYIVWHMPRTQDVQVQTWIRGIPEVAHSNRWSHWQQLRRWGIGVGISLDDADEIARNVKKADVIEYADAVHQEISAWLQELNESDLDHLPNGPQHLSLYPEYQTPSFMEGASDLFDQPIWNLLMRPCIGHIHRHLGELEFVKNVVRARQ